MLRAYDTVLTSTQIDVTPNREKIEDYLRFLTHAVNVSNFCLGKFAQVEPFCELYGVDVDINTKNSYY